MNKLEKACEELNDALRELEDALAEKFQHACVEVPFWVERDATGRHLLSHERWEKGVDLQLAHVVYEGGNLYVEFNGERKKPVTSTPRKVRVAVTDVLPQVLSTLKLHNKWLKKEQKER